jgi:hypothetical protein
MAKNKNFLLLVFLPRAEYVRCGEDHATPSELGPVWQKRRVGRFDGDSTTTALNL